MDLKRLKKITYRKEPQKMTKELIEATKREASLLRKHAKSEELNKLDLATFLPHNGTCCIYGQMTGNCFNERAKELLDLAAIPFSRDTNEAKTLNKDIELCSFSELKDADRGDDTYTYYSAIENYITQDDAKNKNLIDYLKGKTNQLHL